MAARQKKTNLDYVYKMGKVFAMNLVKGVSEIGSIDKYELSSKRKHQV